MPIPLEVYGGESAAIVFPLTVNEAAYHSSPSQRVELVVAGLDGHLRGTVVTDSTRIFFADAGGHLTYFPLSAELTPAGSPYRVYARVYGDDVHWVSFPRGDYYLVEVRDPLV